MNNTNNTLYVLGAGFSKSFHPSVAPLMKDFLQIADKTGKYGTEGKYHDLSRLIYRYFGDTHYQDIEKVMSFLSPSTPDDPLLPTQNRQILYDQLLNVIHETLAWLHTQPASEFVKECYTKFAEHLVATGSSVISFNYDLLLDSLLYQTGQWIGYDGYGAEIPSTYQSLPRPSRVKDGNYKMPKGFEHSSMYLLKPHGSINWGVPAGENGKSTVVYQHPYGCYHKDYIAHNSMPGPAPLDGTGVAAVNLPYQVRFKPFLVPPVLDKTTLLNTPTLRVIWDISREAIARADRIVFIGYSLPVTDFAAEFLFRQGTIRSREKDVIVVSPHPNDAFKQRYMDVFNEFVSFFDGDTIDWFREVGSMPRYVN